MYQTELTREELIERIRRFQKPTIELDKDELTQHVERLQKPENAHLLPAISGEETFYLKDGIDHTWRLVIHNKQQEALEWYNAITQLVNAIVTYRGLLYADAEGHTEEEISSDTPEEA